MHRRFSNLSIKALTARTRSFVAHVMIAALLLPAAPLHAAKPGAPQTGFTAGGLMGLSGFRTLVLTIAMVNKAMRDASENPMDEWRRQNVRIAMGLMPGAIAGMAKHFFNGQLGNGDLPGIQAMLGGFVDKNAGDNYKKFLLKPDKNLIPKTGANFPNVQAPPVPRSSGDAGVATTSSKSGDASVANGPVSKPAVDKMPTKEMVSYSQRLEAKTGSTKSVGYDDSVAKASNEGTAPNYLEGKVAKPEVSSTPQENFGTRETASVGPTGQAGSSAAEVPKNRAGLPYIGSETVMEASREMRSLEGRAPASSGETSSLSVIRTGKEKKGDSASEDEEFFSSVGKDGQAKNKAKLKKKLERRPSTKPTSFRGNNHFLRFFALGLSAITTDAHAEGEEGQRSGADAGMILMGIAAIIGAIAPIFIASTQANADKAIAKTNADAQIKMTEISASTQKEANNIARDVALTQSATAKEVAITNNEAVTDRLNIQLAELRSARGEAQQAERERRQLDESYNQQRIALAEKQSQQNLDLAKETLAAQLSEAGLRQGFSNSANSGNRLTTTTTIAAAGSSNSSGTSRTSAGAGASASVGQAFSQASAAKGTGNVSASGSAAASNSSRGPASVETNKGNTMATRLSGVSARGATGETSELDPNFAASTTYGEDAVKACAGLKDKKEKKDEYLACLKSQSKSRGASPTRSRLLKANTLAFSANAAPRGFAARLSAVTNPTVGGSTAGNLQETAEMRAFAGNRPNPLNKGSSFGDFIGGSRGSAKPSDDFAGYRASGETPHRNLSSDVQKISGGHKAESRGIRGLIEP